MKWHDEDEEMVKTLMGVYVLQHGLTVSESIRRISKDLDRTVPSVIGRWHNQIKTKLNPDSRLMQGIKANSPMYRGEGNAKIKVWEGGNKMTREEFVNHVKYGIVAYWSRQDMTDQEKCDGVAFSILTALDGGSGGCPPFAVRPIDEEGSEGEDISGSLHEAFSALN